MYVMINNQAAVDLIFVKTLKEKGWIIFVFFCEFIEYKTAITETCRIKKAADKCLPHINISAKNEYIS